MKPRSKFTVKFPKIYLLLCLISSAIIIFVMVMQEITYPGPHTAMYVCFGIFPGIPTTLGILTVTMFKVEVNGTTISVRKKLGLCKYSVNISEIKSLHYETVESRNVVASGVKIEFETGKKLNVSMLMINADKFVKYLDKYVDDSKKVQTYKKLGKKTK